MSKSKITLEGAREIAQLLTETLNHPELPDHLESTVSNALTELVNNEEMRLHFINHVLFPKPVEPVKDLDAVAASLAILMTSEKTPVAIHDSIVDTLSDLNSAWADKNVDEYSPEHLKEVIKIQLDKKAADDEVEDDEDEEVEAAKKTRLSPKELDVFAHCLAVVMNGGMVSDEIETHFGDALTQLENDWRNESFDYISEEHIKKTLRGYFLSEEAEPAAS